MDNMNYPTGRNLLLCSQEDLERALENVVLKCISKREISNPEVKLSREAVRQRLHVDNSTLWRWDKTGYLKAIHIGRAVYYKESDVKDIEEGRI